MCQTTLNVVNTMTKKNKWAFRMIVKKEGMQEMTEKTIPRRAFFVILLKI